MGIFRPKMYYKSIYDINYDILKKKNIKVIIFDLDNTIMKVDENEIVPSEKVVELFQELSNDFKLFIASNNKKERVRRIGKYMNVHAFYSVVKPTKKIRKLLLKKYDVKMNEVAMIGDQLLTDIFTGNRLNMYTILVDPLGEKDMKITYFNRWLEKRIIKRIKFKRGEYYEEVL